MTFNFFIIWKHKYCFYIGKTNSLYKISGVFQFWHEQYDKKYDKLCVIKSFSNAMFHFNDRKMELV